MSMERLLGFSFENVSRENGSSVGFPRCLASDTTPDKTGQRSRRVRDWAIATIERGLYVAINSGLIRHSKDYG